MKEQKETARPRGADSAKVIKVIEVKARIGKGTPENPFRFVTEYWSLEGEHLTTIDPEYPDSCPVRKD